MHARPRRNKKCTFKMNMLGKTFPPSLRTNHEPTPYHHAQQMGLSAAKNIAETRALSPRREIASSQHMEMNSFIEAYSTAQAKLEAFTKLFYPVREGNATAALLEGQAKAYLPFRFFSFTSEIVLNYEKVNLVLYTKYIATEHNERNSHVTF